MKQKEMKTAAQYIDLIEDNLAMIMETGARNCRWGDQGIYCTRVEVNEYAKFFYRCRDEFIGLIAKRRACEDYLAIIQIYNEKCFENDVEIYCTVFFFDDEEDYYKAEGELGGINQNLYTSKKQDSKEIIYKDILDKLVNSKNKIVRMAIAKQGYGLDILIRDKDPHVRKTAQKILEKINGNDE